MGAREGSPGPAPSALIKLRHRSRTLSGFLVTVGGTARALPPLVSHRGLDVGVLPVPERRLRLSPPRSWQITPSAGRRHRRGGLAWGGGWGEDYRVLETGSVGWGVQLILEGPLRGASYILGPAVHTAGTAEIQSPLLHQPNNEKLRREPWGAWRSAGTSPAGPITRPAGANVAGASLRPGEISV